MVVSSKWYGKLATVLLYSAIVLSLLIRQFSSQIDKLFTNPSILGIITNIDKPVYYIALICTFFSLFMYIKAFYVKGYINKDEILK